MELRAMNLTDIPAVAALEAECFSQPWSERTLTAELQNPNAVFAVAEQEGKIAGYIGMHRVLDEGYIANVAVNHSFRRQGLGEKLVAHLLAYARTQRLGFLTLEVRESNAPAIRLYGKMGFGLVGRRKGFYANPSEDALLMTVFFHYA